MEESDFSSLQVHLDIEPKELDKEKEIKKPSPCLITVVTLLKSQDRYENSYPLDFKTEQECKKSAERHSTNFNPEVIEKVTSSYEWKKPK